MATEQASLLGIPPELRLHIYDYVLEMDLDCQVLTRMDHKPRTSVPIRSPDTHLRLPWLSLMRSCKDIGAEISFHMQAALSDTSVTTRRHTYVLELDVQHTVQNVTWRRISCAPQDARVLVAHCHVDAEWQCYGDGG